MGRSAPKRKGLASFDYRLAMGAKVPDVPHQASVNSVVIGNVVPAKAKGVIVACMLGTGARGPQQRKQKCSGCAFQNDFHFPYYPKIYGLLIDVMYASGQAHWPAEDLRSRRYYSQLPMPTGCLWPSPQGPRRGLDKFQIEQLGHVLRGHAPTSSFHFEISMPRSLRICLITISMALMIILSGLALQ